MTFRASDRAMTRPGPDGAVMARDLAIVGRAQRTPEGYLDAPAQLTRTGVLEYLAGELIEGDPNPGRIVRVLRLPEDVFDPISLASFERKPLTRGHPPFGEVDATNWRRVSIGIVDQIRPADDRVHVAGRVLVTDAEAVKAADDRREVQISCCYRFIAEPVPGGSWRDDAGVLGEPGLVYQADFFARKIRGNHHALVETGRAGPTAALVLDEGKKMDIAKAESLIESLEGTIKQLREELGAAKAAQTEAEEAKDAAETKAEESEKKAADALRQLGEFKAADEARRKTEAEREVATLSEKHAKVLGMDAATVKTLGGPVEIKRRVLEKLSIPSGATEVETNVAYDTAMRMQAATAPATSTVTAIGALGVAAGGGLTPGGGAPVVAADAAAKAREAYNKRVMEASQPAPLKS